MVERADLKNKLSSSLKEWPKELIPLVLDYVHTMFHEWDASSLFTSAFSGPQDQKVNINIGKSTIQLEPDEDDGSLTGRWMYIKAAHPIDVGPSRWAIDVDFDGPLYENVWFRPRLIVGFLGMQNTILVDGLSLMRVQDSLDICSNSARKLEVENLKVRINVTVNIEREEIGIECIYANRLLPNERHLVKMGKLEPPLTKFCDLYLTVSVTNGVNSITLVNE